MSQRQHTVTKAYLLGFCHPDRRQLRAFDRKNQARITVGVNDASVVNDIYRLPPAAAQEAGVDPLVAERMFNEIETNAAPILKKVRDGDCAVDAQSQMPLAELIASQIVRTSRSRAQFEQMADYYGKVWYEGLTPQTVDDWLLARGKTPTPELRRAVLAITDRPDDFRFKPPQGQGVAMMLQSYQAVLPRLAEGWNWIVVRSFGRPFLTSDEPVAMIGHTVDGAIGVGNASEVWLPVGRHHAVVLTRDHAQPPVLLGLASDHIKRVSRRVALQSHRWVYWHPKDDPLAGIAIPPRKKPMTIETLGRRNRGDGTTGEIIRLGAPLLIPGERLLSGERVRDATAEFDGMEPGWRRASRQDN